MIGQTILNYTIISFIGKGGMGSVYLARHKFIEQQKVAIKIINGDMVNDYTRRRLKEEAELLASLHHHNIVQFIDYHIDEEGNLYLVMEYAEGMPLDKYINTVSGLIVEEKICPLFEPILDAVEVAHKANIIHKDLKPNNIVLSSDGIPKILDFGIAKVLKEGEHKEEIITGTPSFMSPEQVRGAVLDFRSDIYSLGVILYQMLTGSAPYDTTTMTDAQICNKVDKEPLPKMRDHYKYISDKLQKVVDKATAKDPKDRFQSCSEFKKALHNAVYPPKIPVWIKVAAAMAVLLVIGGGLFAWDYNRVKVRYYKDYTEQWGVPQGIGKLSSDEVKHREASYKFEYRKGKLQRMSFVNSYGNLTQHHDSEHTERHSDMRLFYSENGKVDYRNILNMSGKVLYKEDFNENLNTIIFKYNDEYGTEYTLSANTVELFESAFSENSSKKGKISRYLIEYDNDGYISELRYAGFQNIELCDDNGIYGRRYVRDEYGRVLEEHYLNKDKKPKATKGGLGIRRHTYNDNYDWIKTEYLTVDREECTDGNGTSIVVLVLDEYGNRIRESYTNRDGEPVVRTDINVASISYERNDRGLEILREFYDVDGMKCYSTEGYAATLSDYDDNGYLNETIILDLEGNVCMSKYGWASVTLLNDDSGNPLEQWLYDENNELVNIPGSSAGYKIKYDSIGNQLEYVAYGADFKLFVQNDGTCGYRCEYNDRNQIVKFTTIGADLNPKTDNDGIAIVVREYDKRGNVIKCSYLNTDNELVLNSEKLSGWNSSFDENGNEISRIFFNTKGQPVTTVYGYSKWVSTYDEMGNDLTIRYFNDKDELTANKDNIAGYNYKYDDRGNLIESYPVGIDGNITKNYLLQKFAYDDNGNIIEQALYLHGKPATNNLNYHRKTQKYNNRNQVIEVCYYDTKGDLTKYSDDKYAIEKYEYDEKGNIVKIIYQDTEYMPIKCNEGWASSKNEYDAMGRVVKQSFFDINGKPTKIDDIVPVGVCGYDKYGNMNFLAACDENGNYIIHKQRGWAVIRSEYDHRGNCLSISYYDAKDKPMISEVEGYHKVAKKYDMSGNVVMNEYYDTNNKPMLSEETGCFRETIKYNELNQVVEHAYFGVKGEKIDCFGKAHKVVIEYKDDDVHKYHYSKNNDLVSTYIWNGYEWEIVDDSWKDDIKEFNDEMPFNLGEDYNYLSAISCKVTDDKSCQFVFKTVESQYEISPQLKSMYKELVKVLLEAFKEDWSAKVTVTGIVNDSKGRELLRIKI